MWPFTRKTERNPADAPWAYVAVFLLAAAAYTYVQFQPAFRDPDSFYHAKIAVLMAERGVIRDFPWLPFTTLSEAYADHHLLYHVLLIPFVLTLGAALGTKVLAVILASGAVTAFYGLLRVHAVRHSWAYTIILATASSFVFRLNLAKAGAASVGLLLLALIVIRKRKPLLLFVLSWLYVLLHGGWPLMAVVVATYLATRAVVDAMHDRHPVASWASPWFWKRLLTGSRHARADFFGADEARHALAAAAGLACGIVVNPYFPQNLSFYWEQIVQIGVINYQGKIGVGNEWYPYELDRLVGNASGPFILLMLVIALLAAMMFWNDTVRRGRGAVAREEVTPRVASLLLTVFFFLMTLRSQRHVEYFVPFFVFTGALLADSLITRLDFRALVSRLRTVFPRPDIVVPAFLLYWCAIFLYIGARDLQATREIYDDGIPWTKYERAATWLKKNTPEGAVVLHSDWDDFPPLFFHDDRNRYINGLDPTFMYRKDADKYRIWTDISTGTRMNGIAETAHNEFDARFLFVENDHEGMLNAARVDPRLSPVYSDDEATIFASDL
jgi:hypothetical protein